MTTLSQDTYATFGVPLTGLGGGASAVSTFDNLFVTSTLTALDIVAFNISTTYLEADNAVISSLSTLGIYLDGALLTTAGGSELLLNGIPVATTSNISSLSDWALDPAISTVQMNGNNLIAASDISSLTSHASTVVAGTLLADNSFTQLANVSTLVVVNLSAENKVVADSVSSFIGEFSTLIAPYINEVLEINGAGVLEGGGNLGIFGLSTINGEPYSNNASSFFTSSITAQTGVISSLVCQDISTITLTAFSTIHAVSSISSITLDANSLAVSSIKSQGSPTSDLTLDGTARYLNMYAQGMSNVVDRGADVGGNAFYSLIARNGNAGEISLTSEPGFLGNFGRINLTANGGTLAGVGLGGLIELTATTPLISLCNASSAIKFSAAGINSYAGAVPAVGSLTGYNFVYGTLGVNLTAGLPPGALPNTPGTVYLYGTTGVVSGSPVYAYELLGYWNGLSAPSNLRITGRQTISGNSQVVVSNVDSIFFDTGYGALTGVSSINGGSYPPTFSVPSNLVVSSLTSATFVSTPELTVSSINGQEYVPGGVAPDLELSTLTVASFVSTPELFVSSINGQEYIPSGDLQSSIQGATDSFIFCGPAAGGTDGNISISTSTEVGREQSIKMNAATDVQIVAGNLISLSSASLTLGQTGQISIDTNANTVVSNRDYTAFMTLGGTDGTGYGTLGEINIFTNPANTIEPPTFPVVGIMKILSSGVINITSAPGGNLSSFANIAGISSIFGSDLAITANNVKILGVGVSLLDPGGSGFQVVSGGLCKIGGAAGTELQGNLSVSTLTDVSSINGISFPFLPEQELVVSSLTSATFVSTPELFISSINGQEYLPGGVPANLDVSTLTAANYISTPEITVSTLTAGQISSSQMTVSSINGQAFSNNLTLSSLTVANRMIASTLSLNTISSVNLIDFGDFARIGVISGGLYVQNCTSIDPPANTDLLINSEAPGLLYLGGRNGEVALNIGINISTTGRVMRFNQVSGANVGQIIGLDSINGIPITSLNSPNLSISSLTAANYVSTPQLIVSSINSIPVASLAYSGGQFYKVGNQTTPSNSTTYSTWSQALFQVGSDITLDSSGASTFTVNATGVYQLEWMFAVLPADSTWTDVQRIASIDITKVSTIYNQVLDTRSIASAENWAVGLIGTLPLVAGDVISCRVLQPVLAGGSPTVAYLRGRTGTTPDLNTSFTYHRLN